MAKNIMSKQTNKLTQLGDLRQRAQSRLSGPNPSSRVGTSATAAFGVLHKLASSPDTAEHALALLHELQVHQVEIDMQADELRTSLADADSALQRQRHFHDGLPVACFNIDTSTRLLDVNQTGARWLGVALGALIGQSINAFLTPESHAKLLEQLSAVAQGKESTSWEMTLLTDQQGPRAVQAAISADPIGGRYIVVLMERAAPYSPSKNA